MSTARTRTAVEAGPPEAPSVYLGEGHTKLRSALRSLFANASSRQEKRVTLLTRSGHRQDLWQRGGQPRLSRAMQVLGGHRWIVDDGIECLNRECKLRKVLARALARE